MSPHLLTAPATNGSFDVGWLDRPIVYLALAAISLVIALRFLRRAVAPIGALLQAATAAIVAVLTIGLALALIAVAAIGSR